MPRFNLPLFEQKVVPVALGLLRQDTLFLVLFYPLLAIPSLWGQYVDSPDYRLLLALKILERFAQLVMVVIVGNRALASVSKAHEPRALAGLLRVVMLGFLVWFILNMPLASAGVMNNEQAVGLALMLALPSAALVYLHFYYFFCGVFNRLGLGQLLAFARMLLKRDPLMPVLVLVGPIGLTYLVQSLLALISPDGRLLWVSGALSMVAPLSWVLSSYLGVSAGLLLLSETEWRDCDLDPYRESRLSTLAIQGQSPLNSLMLPKIALPALIMGVLIGIGNLARMASEPPAATISIEHIQLSGTHANLTLNVKDEKYLFRGFQPIRLRLAGGEGKVIALRPAGATLPDAEPSVLLAFPHDQSERTLLLSFITDRDAKELQRLEDLYLWYGNSKLLLLDMSKAVVTDAAG